MGISQKLKTNFSNNNQLIVKDLQINSGTKFLFDFANIDCWNPSSQSVPTGAGTATINNLVASAPTATLQQSTGGDWAFNTTKKGFTYNGSFSSASTNRQIDLGSSYLISNLSNDYAICLWCAIEANASGTISSFLIGRGSDATTAANSQFYIQAPTSATALTTVTFNFSSRQNLPTSSLTQGAIAQIGITREFQSSINAFRITSWVNGNPVGAFFQTSPLQAPSPTNPNITNIALNCGANPYKSASYYRTWLEDCTVSGRSVSSAIMQDYARNVSRF